MGGGAGGSPFNPLENFGELFGMTQGGGMPAAQPSQPTPPTMPAVQSPGMGKPVTLFGRALQSGIIPGPKDPRTMTPGGSSGGGGSSNGGGGGVNPLAAVAGGILPSLFFPDGP